MLGFTGRVPLPVLSSQRQVSAAASALAQSPLATRLLCFEFPGPDLGSHRPPPPLRSQGLMDTVHALVPCMFAHPSPLYPPLLPSAPLCVLRDGSGFTDFFAGKSEGACSKFKPMAIQGFRPHREYVAVASLDKDTAASDAVEQGAAVMEELTSACEAAREGLLDSSLLDDRARAPPAGYLHEFHLEEAYCVHHDDESPCAQEGPSPPTKRPSVLCKTCRWLVEEMHEVVLKETTRLQGTMGADDQMDANVDVMTMLEERCKEIDMKVQSDAIRKACPFVATNHGRTFTEAFSGGIPTPALTHTRGQSICGKVDPSCGRFGPTNVTDECTACALVVGDIHEMLDRDGSEHGKFCEKKRIWDVAENLCAAEQVRIGGGGGGEVERRVFLPVLYRTVRGVSVVSIVYIRVCVCVCAVCCVLCAVLCVCVLL